MTVLLETTRSAQGDAAILLLAVGLIGLLFSALSLIADWMDRRAWRRDVARAHRPRPFDWQADNLARARNDSTPRACSPARPFAAAHGVAETQAGRGGGSTRQENEWQ